MKKNMALIVEVTSYNIIIHIAPDSVLLNWLQLNYYERTKLYTH